MPSPAICLGQNLTVNSAGQLQMAPWSVPSLLNDVLCPTMGDGALVETQYAPGKLLVSQQLNWVNNTPVAYTIRIVVIRRYKQWVNSNPNAIEFRDRWNWAINGAVAEPVTTGLYNGQCGSAEDLGTNDLAMPNAGLFYHWWGTGSGEEWVWETVNPDDTFNFWYEAYVWTPPPWSDDGNLNSPQYVANLGFSRIQLWGFPQQGSLVTG
jgi:hypothetical protein